MADHAKHQKLEQASKRELRPTAETQLEQEVSPDIANVVNLQRYVGNSGVQRMLKNGSIPTMPKYRFLTKPHGIQREGEDGGTTTTTDAGTSPDAAPAVDPRLQGILDQRFLELGDRFDVFYEPTGDKSATDRPISGKTTIILKLHITFRNFNAVRSEAPYNTMRFTPEQRRDFNWKPDEQEKFKQDIVPSIQNGWKEKHLLSCKDPGLEELNSILNVEVQLVGSAKEAHNKVTAQKIPQGAPRYRSFVQGDTSVLDRLDPTEDETHGVDEKLWRIQPFDNDSAEVGPVQSQLDTFITEFDQLEPKGSPEKDREFADKFTIRMVGRASSTGAKAHNKALSEKRAKAAEDYVTAKSNRSTFAKRIRSQGETGTTEDSEFRRVDIYLVKNNAVKQNIAAHEAGHMFGLGDEYEDAEATDSEGRGRFTGDKPEHNADVQQALGPDAPANLEVKNGESMMAVGSKVGPEHYTPFILKLESMTGLDWTIKKTP